MLFFRGRAAALSGLALLAMLATEPASACPDPGLGMGVTRADAGVLAAGIRRPASVNALHDLRGCPQPGRGFASMFPELVLRLDGSAGGQRMVMSLPGDCDATLLVQDPGGGWHFADWTPDAPVVLEFERPAAGDWAIFVGLTRQSHCRTTLEVRGAPAGGQAPLPPKS